MATFANVAQYRSAGAASSEVRGALIGAESASIASSADFSIAAGTGIVTICCDVAYWYRKKATNSPALAVASGADCVYRPAGWVEDLCVDGEACKIAIITG